MAVGCQQKKQLETKFAEINEPVKSNFDLNSDYADFKTKMTESDTLNVWVDHSVCTYQGYERLMITKKDDSIKILSEFKDYDKQNPEWKIVFEKNISESYTTWNFGNYMKRNKNRLTTDSTKYSKIEVKSGLQKLRFVTKGLVDLNRFKADYDTIMRKLYKPKGILIYGHPIFTETEIKDAK